MCQTPKTRRTSNIAIPRAARVLRDESSNTGSPIIPTGFSRLGSTHSVFGAFDDPLQSQTSRGALWKPSVSVAGRGVEQRGTDASDLVSSTKRYVERTALHSRAHPHSGTASPIACYRRIDGRRCGSPGKWAARLQPALLATSESNGGDSIGVRNVHKGGKGTLPLECHKGSDTNVQRVASR